MIGQEGIGFKNGIPPIRYDAIDSCLKKVLDASKKYNASVHLPYNLGCGLAGGKWSVIEELIKRRLSSENIEVIAYDINGLREK